MKNVKTLSFTIFFSFFAFSIYAQVKFKKVYGGQGYDYAYSGIQTFDKGYVTVGTTNSFGLTSNNIYLIKTDSFGIPQWNKEIGGINIDKGLCIKQISDSSLIIAGFTNDNGQKGYDMQLIKTDRNGNLIWTKNYGGNNWDFANSVAQTTDGGFIIAGGTYSYGIGDEDFYLVKTNVNGDTVWTKTYGSTAEDEAKSIKQTNDGGYIIIGNTKKNNATAKSDILCIKTNSSGDTLWTKIYSNPDNDYGNDITQTADGGYAIGGTIFNITKNTTQAYIIKTDINGFIQHAQEWGDISSIPTETTCNSIIQNHRGNLVFTGKIRVGGTLDMVVYESTPGGFWVNSTTYGTTSGDEEAFFIQQTQDKGYIIGGNTNGIGYGLNDILLVKTDSLLVNPSPIFVGINESNTNNTSVNLFPNPASTNTKLKIYTSTALNRQEALIEIYSMYGEKIITEFRNNENTNSYNLFETTLNTYNLTNGIYIIKVSINEFITSQKLIIKH